MNSHKKNLILGGSGWFHIFCRIGFGILELLRNVYVDLTINSWFDVSFDSSWLYSSLVVVTFRISFRFIISFMKKDIVV
jgi:hypothetical protein